MQLGKYTLGRLIGQGGAGAVYESSHPLLKRAVAVKLMLSNDADARREFLNEAQTVALLSHPCIINIFDVDEFQGQPFMVMELLPGSLADRIAQGPIPLTEAVELLLPLLEALAYAHKQGLIHRDLKPANVLLRADGTPVLADFGLAFQATGQQPSDLVGTPEYMAPEQLRREPLDVRTDIYALGALLFELLTGRTPFVGDTNAQIRGHLQGIPPAPSSLVATIPPAADALVLRMLEKDPAARYVTVAELVDALRQTVAPPPAPPSKPPTQRRRRSPQPAVAQARPAPPPVAAAVPNLPKLPQIPALQLTPASGQFWLLLGLGLALLVLLLVAVSRLDGDGRISESATSTVSTSISVSISTSVRGGDATAEISNATPYATRELTPLPLSQLSEAQLIGSQAVLGSQPFSYAGVTWQYQSNGIAWFLGEIRNDGTEPRANIRVRINLYDAADKLRASEDVHPEIDMLHPGETSPFALLFGEGNLPPETFERLEVEVLSQAAEDYELNEVSDPIQIATEQVGFSTLSRFFEVRGNMANSGDTPISYPKVVVTFYDSDHVIVGVASAYADDPDNLLQPNETAPFRIISFISTSETAATYYLQTRGREER
jgi:serine/threonine protein kinase